MKTRRDRLSALKLLIITSLFIVLIPAVSTAEVADGDGIIFAGYRKINSAILGEKRKIAVYLPEGYEQPDGVYPVLYMLGGDNKHRLMKMAATIEELDGAGKIPQMIVIGIDEPNAVRDYFPQSLENRPGSGKADTFIKFLEEELIPWVEDNYRTAGYRVLYGASNAGMFTVYTLLANPQTFSGYIAPSASVGWFPEFMLDQARVAFAAKHGIAAKLYLNYGTDDIESIVLNALPHFVAFFDSTAPENLTWTNEVIVDGGHVPYVSEHNGLCFIFHDWPYPQERLVVDGLPGLWRYYERLSKTYGFQVRVPSSLLMDLGMSFYREKQWDKAREIFHAYINEYPLSVRAHYMMGNVHLQAGDTTQARDSFIETLKIDPQFQRAKDKLKQIGLEREIPAE